MYIAILVDGEVENELNVEWCCRDCTLGAYGWDVKQYNFVASFVKAEKPIPLPLEVSDDSSPNTQVRAFAAYIKSMKL